MNIQRDLFRGYYLSTEYKMWDVDWLHWTSCGSYDGKFLQFIVFDKTECLDTQQKFQEMFDLPAGIADRIVAMLVSDPETLIASLTPNAQQAVTDDIVAGFTMDEVLERNIAIMVPEYVGRTFVDVFIKLNPTPVVDAEGNEYLTIQQCSLE